MQSSTWLCAVVTHLHLLSVQTLVDFETCVAGVLEDLPCRLLASLPLPIHTLAASADPTERPRRRASGHKLPSPTELQSALDQSRSTSGATSSIPGRRPLAAIPGTPSQTPPSHTPHMSLSRSPSPHPNGGWYSKGLSDDSPPPPRSRNGSAFASTDDQWAAARARSQKVRGIPSIITKNEGFFSRSRRKISSTLPSFNKYGPKTPYDWREAEKVGRGRWYARAPAGGLSSLKTLVGNVLRKFRFLFIILTCVILLTVGVSKSGEYSKSCRPISS